MSSLVSPVLSIPPWYIRSYNGMIANLADPKIADIVALEGEDTFTRPIYAGNAILKIKSSPKDKIKIVTVRTTAFDKAAIGSGAAEVEEVKEVSGDSKPFLLL